MCSFMVIKIVNRALLCQKHLSQTSPLTFRIHAASQQLDFIFHYDITYISLFSMLFLFHWLFYHLHYCWNCNLISVCVSFTQPSSFTFIRSSISKSFCQSIFPAKCHRMVALHLCVIYFLAPIINVITICTSCSSFSIPPFHLFLHYRLILFVFVWVNVWF